MRPPASRKIFPEGSSNNPLSKILRRHPLHRMSPLFRDTAQTLRALLAGCAFAVTAATSVLPASAQADTAGSPQDAAPAAPGQHRGGQYAGMGRAGGEVTAVSGNSFTVKGENGRTTTIVTTDNTRVMKDRGPVKVSDLHVGDGLMAFGNLDPATGTLHAAMVMATDAAELKAMRDNLGKTYITGKVTAIDLDDAKMTVERPDHVAQTIGFDESTSFKRAVRGDRGERPANGGNPGSAEGHNGGGGGFGGGMGGGMGATASGGAAMDRAFANGESITLGDIKVGDNVMGTGVLKGGIFTPNRLLESPPRPPRIRGNEAPGQGSPSGSTATSGSSGPGPR